MFAEPNVRFVEVWHYYGYWNIFLGRKYDKYKKIGLFVRLILYSAVASAALTKIATDGVLSVVNGSMIYFPLCIYTFFIPLILFVKRKYLFRLLRDFDECWASLNDDGDRKIFDKYNRRTWLFARVIHFAIVAQLIYYVVFPIFYSTVFHYVFDFLSEPYILSYPHTSYLGNNVSWNREYYAVVISGVYCIFEIQWALFGWVLMYIVIIGYCYPIFIITKKAIQDVGDSKIYNGSSEKRLRKAILSHNLLVKVNRDLKAFLGLPCAFQTIFTSLVLTLTVFTTTRSTDMFVVGAYGSAVFLFGLASLLYCSLGQILENKSEGLFEELYRLPWYKFSPHVRKDLNMMLRQARTPFTIDYHGNYKMNLENFMEILKNAYSFFALLQTMESKA